MRDPTRTVLVVTQRPHAWALLRDRLDPELLHVAWILPASLEVEAPALSPWALAGDSATLPEQACRWLRSRLVSAHWVGDPPPGLPTRARRHPDWASLAAALRESQRACLGGLRLAPAHGLRLPDGRFMHRTGPLEALLAAHPQGLELDGSWLEPAATTRRLRELLQRTGAPVDLVVEGRRLRLVERTDAGAR